MANTRQSRQKSHGFENNPPRQERFPQELGGVEMESTAKPLGTVGLNYPSRAEDGDTEFRIPQRNRAYGEFLRESHTKGVKKDGE